MVSRIKQYNKVSPLKGILAIVAITALCMVALHEGLDGQICYLGIASIAGLAGYEMRTNAGTSES